MLTERIAPIEDPGLAVRGFYAIGRRLFGQVPTPQKLMAHRPALMLGLGALHDWRTSDHFSGREKAALELTEEIVADDREVSDACFARVREYFSEADVLELVFVIGYQVFASKFAKAFRLAPQGFAARA